MWLFKGNHTAVTALGQVLKTLSRPCSVVASLIHSLYYFAGFLVLFHSLFFLLSPSVLLVPEHYQMSVLESAPVSSTVGRVVAKDLDEGINAEMKYSLVDGDGLDVFDINTDPNYQVGIITVRKVKNFLFIVIYMANCPGYILCVEYSLTPAVTWLPLCDSSPFPAVKHNFFNIYC